MKKISLKVSALLLAGSFLCSSCIGSFKLFNKYEDWQCHMTSNKFVNGIVGLILQPIVGGICLFVDALVLNTIEFWSGSNPMAAAPATQVVGKDGRLYAVQPTKDGYRITDPAGQLTVLTHNEATDSWSMTQNGVTKELFRYNADGTIQANLMDGQALTVTNDEAGLAKVREAIENDNCYALR